MQVRDGAQLAQFAPTPDRINGRQAKSAAGGDDAAASEQPVGRRDAGDPAHQPYLQRAASIAARHADVRAVCFGHTHQPITLDRAVDAEPGWPLPHTTARYFNSGAWVRTLNIGELSPAQLTFAYLAQSDHYRKGRDYLRVCWPNHPQIPVVETRRWGETR
jgi:hypothetical protein